jgi:hypothetical protein
MPTRRRVVLIVPLPSKTADAGMLIADATGRYSDARLELVDGQLVVTSTKQAGQ